MRQWQSDEVQGVGVKTGRLEAFSDGVIAVIITIMVLELKVPHVGTREALLAVVPSFLVYGMSFLVVAIMWVNHHHFLERALRADSKLMWSNNNLLFWMSLIPFVTGYLGENCSAPLAVAIYGADLALTSGAFLILHVALAAQDANDTERQAEMRGWKRKSALSIAGYGVAAALAFVSIQASYAIFVIIPLMYFWPEWRCLFK
jgi:uncharacterized membrane protein